jgi:hypothetical protein
MKRNNYEEIAQIAKPSKELLEELYIRRRLSIVRVAETIRSPAPTVYQLLVKYNIPRRSVSKATMRYTKKPTY